MTPPIDYRMGEIANGTLCAICHANHDSVKCPHARRFFDEGSGDWLKKLWAENDPEFARRWER